jgi:hypothetical protein
VPHDSSSVVIQSAHIVGGGKVRQLLYGELGNAGHWGALEH